MTIKTIAATAAFLLIANQAEARSVCYHCGHYAAHRHHHRSIKKTTHKKIYLSPLVPAKTENTPANGLAAEARRFLGMRAWELGLRRTLWCSAFIRKLTHTPGVDDRAISWLRKPRIKPTINAIAVMAHHVGIVMGFTKNHDPILISGNHGNKVGIGAYSKQRIIAYVRV